MKKILKIFIIILIIFIMTNGIMYLIIKINIYKEEKQEKFKNNIKDEKYDIESQEGWKKYENNPVLGNEITGTLFDPNVIKDSDGIYKMYVSWRPMDAIAISTSIDGINWSDLEIVLDNDEKSGWEDRVNRASVIYKDGIYQMWYTGQSGNKSKIGYAVSDNGKDFKKIVNPVIIPEFEYEKESVMNPYVIFDDDEKAYKMWYAAGETYEPDVIAYATSEDGINWKKYENNPIFTANDDKKALDSFKVGGCEVKKISNDEYLMFYIGYTDINTARIFVAKSKDGITNWKRNGKPLVSMSKNMFDSDACYKPSVLYENDKWMLWYNGRARNKEYIGLVTYEGFEIFK